MLTPNALALSARFSVMTEPGNANTPIGIVAVAHV
jgi:hypothetical protein